MEWGFVIVLAIPFLLLISFGIYDRYFDRHETGNDGE